MLESARIALGYVGDTSANEYLKDTKLQDAVVRRFEIIGEAAKRVQKDMRSKFTTLEWTAICGMRDVLIHQYDGVDHELVYETVREKLPELVDLLASYLGKHSAD